MITTKSGKGGKKGIGVSFSTAATMDTPYQFIEEQHLFGQGERAFEWQYDKPNPSPPPDRIILPAPDGRLSLQLLDKDSVVIGEVATELDGADLDDFIVYGIEARGLQIKRNKNLIHLCK